MSPAGLRFTLETILIVLNLHFWGVSSFSHSDYRPTTTFLGQDHFARNTRTSKTIKARPSLHLMMSAFTKNTDRCLGEPHVENVLFIECGKNIIMFGADLLTRRSSRLDEDDADDDTTNPPPHS